MIVAAVFFALGIAIGWSRAARRGGTTGDKVQYAFAHAIPAGIIGLIISVVLVRLGV
ncbi:MAG: hypothetical protein AAF713_17950 [Pseudomonadota bacterium]